METNIETRGTPRNRGRGMKKAILPALALVLVWTGLAAAFCDQAIIDQAAEARNIGDYTREFRLLRSISAECPPAGWRVGYIHEHGIGRVANPYQAFREYATAQARGFCPDKSCGDTVRIYRTLIPEQRQRARILVDRLNKEYGLSIVLPHVFDPESRRDSPFY